MRTPTLFMLIMLIAVEIGFGSPESFNESAEPMKNVTLKEVYFAGEEAEFLANFMPSEASLIDPAGHTIALNFEKSDGLYYAKYRFEKGVLLGEYKLLADEVEKRFFVDFCELNITHEGGFLNLTAKTIFSEPKFDFSIDSEIGGGVGNVSIPINAGRHTYRVSCGNSILEGEFEVRFDIELRGGEIFATLNGERVNAKLKVYADKNFEFYDFFRAKDVNSTDFTVEAEYKHLKAKRNFSLSLDRELYFPNQTVLIRTNLAETVKIFDPANREFLIEVKDGIASFSLEKDVLLGEYRAEVEGFEKRFFVDFYNINAGIADGILRGSVKWHFVRPDSIIYRTELGEGAVNLSENGEFFIALKDGWEFVELECGNAFLRLTGKSLEVGIIYFVGDKVVIKASFKPEESFILLGEEKIPIDFSNRNGSWFYEFVAERVGTYRLISDGIVKEFIVDSCSIEAWTHDKRIQGRATANFSEVEVGFIILPMNSSGSASLRNGAFEIDLPEEAEEVLLFCRNSEVRLNLKPSISEFRSFEFKGMVFNLTLSKGRFDELSFDGENASLVISGIGEGEEVEVSIEMPFEIPEGLHVYYWKEANGSLIPVNYSLSEDRRKIVFRLQDGVVDEDGEANGVIVDPLKLYIPKFRVEKELETPKGKLKVKGERDFEISIETSGKLRYLAFVDPENLPSKPAEFPFGLLKFSIEVEKGGEAELRIRYPSLESLIDDEGKAKFFKFNPRMLKWDSFEVEAENDTVVLRLRDGGFGDEDGEENGIISDDGGVGWVGFSGSNGAAICRDGKINENHVYWLYVPSGQSFTIRVYDGDGLLVRVYYPNGTMQGSYTAGANDAWNSFTIQTANSFGWWRLEIFEDSWGSANGNYYGLNITGADEINLRVNSSYIVSEQTLYGTNDSVIVGEESFLSLFQNYYVFADSFSFSVYDPDGNNINQARLNVTIVSPTGTVQGWNLFGNRLWTTIQAVSGEYGVWNINVSQISDHNDYGAGGNHYRLAVNLSEGLYFKPPVVLRIKGKILHDLFPLGRNEGEDVPIRGVELLLVEDMNGNKLPDSGDRILRRNITDASGNFSFVALKDITRTYFVVVNSRSINATNASLVYNSGFNITHVWAEQSYQTNESNYSQLIPFFGGRSELSDNVSYSGNIFTGRAEHFITINSSAYKNETLYFGFNFSLVTNTRDADDDENPRFCQGCFRQFVLNSNATAGKQRSFFVMSVPANASDSSGAWWFIPLNANLGSIQITDPIEINGTVLNADMSVNESNKGYVIYDYETKALKSVSSQESIPVGVGIDGIPFSGDEALLYAIPKPEIEIYGGSLNPVLNFTSTAINSEFRNISIFGSQSNTYPGPFRSYAENLLIENVFAGLRANGSDPKLSNLNRTGGANLWLEGNNTTVRNSVIAFAERYGLIFYTPNLRAGNAENVIAYRNGLIFEGGDNIGVESSASNVTISRCVSAKAAAQGIETWFASGGIRIFNCSIEANAMGNESGYVTETAGIRIHANNSIVDYNLVRDNFGHGVIVVSYSKPVLNATITRNSIYNNSKLGIDLVSTTTVSVAHSGDNVTLNDGLMNCSQANCGVDYPVITYAELDGDELYVEGFIGNESIGSSSAFANAVVEIYLVRNSTAGDNLLGNNWNMTSILDKYYGEGWIYLGSLYANENGYFSGSIGVAGRGVDESSIITAMTILNGNSSEFGPNARIKKTLNVSAEIALHGMNATIKIKAFEKAKNVKVYWIKPYGLNVAFEGNYDDYGTQGSVYWWKFNSLVVGEEKNIQLSLSGTNFMLSDALNIAIDP